MGGRGEETRQVLEPCVIDVDLPTGVGGGEPQSLYQGPGPAETPSRLSARTRNRKPGHPFNAVHAGQ